MTDLNSFVYTDNLHDVLAIYINNLLASTLRSEYKNVETLSADKTLTDADTPIQRLNCNGVARIVKVPTANAVENHPFLIVNSSAGAYTITVKSNDGATTHATVNQGESLQIFPDGAGGYKVPISTMPGAITASSTDTLTNKRITKRVSTEASNATPAIAADSYDMHTITALAAAATFGAPTGTPTQGQQIIYRIKDNGTARALSWNAIYRAMGTALPTTTVLSKTLYLGFMYNSTDSKWDLIASAQEA